MILKLTLAGTLPLLDRAAAALLEWGFRMLAAWTGAAAQWFGPVAAVTPPSWYVAVFYLLLFTALGVRRPTVSRFAGMGAATMLAILPLIKAASPGQVTVINHGANTPALLAYLPPGGEVAEIVDVPDSAVGALAGRELRQQGALRARIGFSRGTRDSDRGAAALARQLPATAFLPDGQRLSAAFRRNLQADNLKVWENLHTIRVRAPRPGAVEWRTADGTEIAATSGDNGRTVRIRTRSGRVISATLPWSSLPVRWRCLTE